MPGARAYGLGNLPSLDKRHTVGLDMGTMAGMFFFLSPTICQMRRKLDSLGVDIESP